MNRKGFTLVEVLVGLVITGITVSIAAGVFLNVTDTMSSMAHRAESAEKNAAGLLWLQEAIAGAAGPAAGGYFHGAPDSLRFRSRGWVPRGWVEPGEVTITLTRGRIVADMPHGPVTLPDSLVGVTFDYLGEYGADSPWLRHWNLARAPLAVRLRRAWPSEVADTMLFMLGGGR